MLRLRSFAAASGTALLCADAAAQLIGYNYSGLTLPVVAETSSYASAIYVHNPGANTHLAVALTRRRAGRGARVIELDADRCRCRPGRSSRRSIDREPDHRFAGLEMIRLLDVFGSLNAPAGDYDNVRAVFESIVPVGGGTSIQFTAACTVQNNTSFDADFRVAKAHN